MRGPWLVLSFLVACSAPPTAELAPTPSPSATPVPALSVELLDASVGSTRVLVRVLSPRSGAHRVKEALEAVRIELARVAGLQGGPELDAAHAAAAGLARALGSGAPVPAEELRVAYAIDRAADRLLAAGMADFYIDGGDVVRAQGSQDASIGRGWHATIFGPDGDAVGTARLKGQALAQRAGAAPACTAVAGSAVLATGARGALERLGRAPEHRPDLGLRVGLPGEERQNPAFQSLLTPIGASY